MTEGVDVYSFEKFPGPGKTIRIVRVPQEFPNEDTFVIEEGKKYLLGRRSAGNTRESRKFFPDDVVVEFPNEFKGMSRDQAEITMVTQVEHYKPFRGGRGGKLPSGAVLVKNRSTSVPMIIEEGPEETSTTIVLNPLGQEPSQHIIRSQNFSILVPQHSEGANRTAIRMSIGSGSPVGTSIGLKLRAGRQDWEAYQRGLRQTPATL